MAGWWCRASNTRILASTRCFLALFLSEELMNTIVMNTLTGAVTEYDWAFQSITPTHAGGAAGLFLLGGDKDGALPIPANVLTGKQLMDAAQKKRIPDIYYA